jgi:hypothetical protein
MMIGNRLYKDLSTAKSCDGWLEEWLKATTPTFTKEKHNNFCLREDWDLAIQSPRPRSSAFEPSKNTTTEPAQPLPAKLPIQVHDNTEPSQPTAENEVRYVIPLPPALPHSATRVDLHHENHQLWHTIHLAEVQLERDFTQMKLMDSENGRLRKQVFAKEKRKVEKRVTSQAHARLMTGDENLDALAEHDFKKHWKEVMKELAPIFKCIRKKITEHDKEVAVAAAAARKTTARGRGRGGRRGQAGGRSRGHV